MQGTGCAVLVPSLHPHEEATERLSGQPAREDTVVHLPNLQVTTTARVLCAFLFLCPVSVLCVFPVRTSLRSLLWLRLRLGLHFPCLFSFSLTPHRRNGKGEGEGQRSQRKKG
jgi:hypothetical protein